MCWSAEDKAIDYLPHIAQLLYLRVLRRHADVNSGIVGLSIRLSYQMMIDILAVRSSPDIGKPAEKVSISRIRLALNSLEHAGLIEPVTHSGERRQLAFILPLIG